ncbi:IS5 family transposase [Mucilaginibacter sp. 5C4]|nr:IS5 family transposase [Mucilaginibacter sp. 5C4]
MGLFDSDFRIEKLILLGDPLHRLSEGVDFEIFRSKLEECLSKLAQGAGGRPPYDYVLMFKILVLQRYFNLSDEQVEFQVCDRISFMRFLGLTVADDVPDSKTVWAFRERLADLGLVQEVFELFIKELEKLGLILNAGKIVDASFIEVPKQRNTREENKQVKEGETPASFTENPAKLAQKDIDARWTKKNKVSYYGYKNHVKVDGKSKLVTGFTVTDASVHDSQEIEGLIGEKDKGQPLYADSAYTGEELHIRLKGKEVQLHIHEKGVKNKPLTETQLASNKEKSKTRVRVEHVFGFMENNMNGMGLAYIGIKRIESAVGMMNLVYNMFRKVQLEAI